MVAVTNWSWSRTLGWCIISSSPSTTETPPHVERLMRVESVVSVSEHWPGEEVRREGGSSGVVLVTWFKITKFITNSPRVAL
ncbi:hypothetical protein TNCV_1519871 [Trichonephila clavipes]|nr:hypothetical protein TNCV_1519871 [Trichonephila clavipes]